MTNLAFSLDTFQAPATPAGDATAAPAPANLVEALAAVYTALAKVSDKEGNRDDLADGTSHRVRLLIVGEIDGNPQRFRKQFDVDLTVGHKTTRATSATPSLPALLGHILAKLNAKTRDKILRELPDDFAANGNELPEVAAGIADATAKMLERLRAKKSVEVRGAVSCRYQESAPTLSVVE